MENIENYYSILGLYRDNGKEHGNYSIGVEYPLNRRNSGISQGAYLEEGTLGPLEFEGPWTYSVPARSSSIPTI